MIFVYENSLVESAAHAMYRVPERLPMMYTQYVFLRFIVGSGSYRGSSTAFAALIAQQCSLRIT